MAENKYGHLVKKMDMRDTQRKSGGNADFINGFGGKDLEGLALNFTWAIHKGLGDWHGGRDPHVHPYDECLVFVGLDPDNPGYPNPWILRASESAQNAVYPHPGATAVPLSTTQPTVLRYRLLIHEGDHTAIDIAEIHSDFGGF